MNRIFVFALALIVLPACDRTYVTEVEHEHGPGCGHYQPAAADTVTLHTQVTVSVNDSVVGSYQTGSPVAESFDVSYTVAPEIIQVEVPGPVVEVPVPGPTIYVPGPTVTVVSYELEDSFRRLYDTLCQSNATGAMKKLEWAWEEVDVTLAPLTCR